ncbi:hypothetical protein [Leucobacter musarum]|uniref:hypothetical protein n=1 Tax=Leucobacter musarum TaxID=1930747 RepID=UPI0006A79B26|nr:hypothetical protein [Leucobacter musarum]
MSALLELILMVAVAVLPACATEDASICVWDTAAHGNGAGSSFVDLGGRAFPVELQGAQR